MKKREVITLVVAVLVVGLLFVALKLSGGGNPKSASEKPTAPSESAEPSGDSEGKERVKRAIERARIDLEEEREFLKSQDEGVEMDKRVQVPIARYSHRQYDMMGRIVINVYSDEHAGEGRFRMADGKEVFVDDEDMVDFIKKQKEEWDTKAQKARLYLRADRKVHFTYVRRAIRAAAAAGIHEVIFASLWSRNGNPRNGNQKERDMALPSAAPSEAQPDIQPFFIKVSHQGYIFVNVGAAKELLDIDVQGAERTLPRLDQRLAIYAPAIKASSEKHLVQVSVEAEAEQQRVSDVLNHLAKHGIDWVTFTDLVAQDEQSK